MFDGNKNQVLILALDEMEEPAPSCLSTECRLEALVGAESSCFRDLKSKYQQEDLQAQNPGTGSLAVRAPLFPVVSLSLKSQPKILKEKQL